MVAAALKVIDTEGVEALSMRGVAQVLGTGAASLYAHVAGREELVGLVVDRVLSEVGFPERTRSGGRTRSGRGCGTRAGS